MIATLAFALVPVQDATTKEWSLGVLQNPGQYLSLIHISVRPGQLCRGKRSLLPAIGHTFSPLRDGLFEGFIR